MRRAIVAIVLGIVVGIVTAVPGCLFLMAATWSSIHGGMSEIVLAVLSALAIAVPAGGGFLAFYTVSRRRPTREMAETASSSPTPEDRRATE
jgi:uncharacterized membrane protein